MFDNLEQKKDSASGESNKIPEKKVVLPSSFSNPSTVKKEQEHLPKKTEDMFAGLEDIKPPVPKAGSGIPNIPAKEIKTKSQGGIVKTLFFVIVLLLVIAIAAIVAIKIFDFPNVSSIISKTEKVTGDEVNKQDDSNSLAELVAPVAEEKDLIVEDVLLDTDGDGLGDDEEILIGTDPNNPDTDGDGLLDREEFLEYKTDPLKVDTDEDELSDYDEIITYKTDPNNPDTDGDTYLDGAEVKGGYDPNGEGEL